MKSCKYGFNTILSGFSVALDSQNEYFVKTELLGLFVNFFIMYMIVITSHLNYSYSKELRLII